MPCSACNREVKVIARGYCKACYERWKKRGTTDYAVRVRTFCQVDECGRAVVSHGLCDMHRLRLRDHGKLESNRPDSWGAKTNHPLYNSWSYMMRYRSQHEVAAEWTDFLQFVMDVKERPSAKHKLFSADDTKPIGPDNYVWKEAITQKAEGEDARTYGNRASKVYRAVRKEAYKGYELKKRFGMSLEEYEALDAAQGGVCAICKLPESRKIRGKPTKLAVDHCHTGGQVRALLCANCNAGLGSFRDDPELMLQAIEFLRKHKPK